ncbi:hypothetical protein [Bradyrhizobium sp. 153]|uniref:hypothetical protein n=1 Tax=Bradyrhizobium sp. 153 TaxID=2782627 RepID=UPI001FFAD252|nr:hypothetical protein [Bradyrhizobium sp. 153]MCK1668682.1 hypothetical protein [Bradyrhizobium sp. 153]
MIPIDTRRWEREHGRKPTGRQFWTFRIISPRITAKDFEFTTEEAMTYPAACKVAREKAALRKSDQIVLLA